jgi:peptidoglycan hydrolase-like protein with peptidoglycan-binding domain
MDLLKALLIYMAVLVSSAVQMSPGLTPVPPGVVATPTPYITVSPAPTAVPTPVPTPTAVAYTTLYVGDRGENVRKLQRRLSELGYLTGTADGIYGQQTKRAVERFQYYNGLQTDGIAGPNTLSVLYDDPNAVVAPIDITTSPTRRPTATPSVTALIPIYYLGSNNELLYTETVSLKPGSHRVNANDAFVPAGYTLTGTRSVVVNVSSAGVASPMNVSFNYIGPSGTATPTARPTKTPSPGSVSVPVLYIDDHNTVLFSESAACAAGDNLVTYNPEAVPGGYELIGSGSVSVHVSLSGIPVPDQVIFTFKASATATASPSPTTAPTAGPTGVPTGIPTNTPEPPPTDAPTNTPEPPPTDAPTNTPEPPPTEEPTNTPEPLPTDAPTNTPEPVSDYILPDYIKSVVSEDQPIYTGPGTDYYRAEGGAAIIPAGTAIRVYGRESEWVLAGYGLSSGDFRIGFISAGALSGISVPDLVFASKPATARRNTNLTDDPVINKNPLCSVANHTTVTFLSMLDANQDWAYVELYSDALSAKIRGFVPAGDIAR